MKPYTALMAKLQQATQQLMKEGPLAATAAIQDALANPDADNAPAASRSPPTPQMKNLNAAPAWAHAPAADRTRRDEPSAARTNQAPGTAAIAEVPDLAALRRQAGITLPKGSPLPAATKRRARSPAPPLPAGARYLALSYEGAADQRDYKLYIPGSYAGQALPLLVMLHGCTQDADDFAAGTRMNLLAEEAGCLVVWPQQAVHANSSRCWNWFNTADQQRGKGEPALIAGIIQQVMASHAVDPARISIAGLSAGGAMAAVVAAVYPELFHAVGVHSGLPFGAARDLPSALQSMRAGAQGKHRRAAGPKVIVFHGDRDATVHPSNGQHIVTGSVSSECGMAPESETKKAPGGRKYTRHVYRGEDASVMAEHWVIHGAGHAWAGGSAAGTFTDCAGPDASRAMLQFFDMLRAPAAEQQGQRC
ncbi:extracellular catalytic domain type 1 short-chain-length polyhydroxyalkanoate depolymerase [Massilia sp. SM-13]|uniref:extracellular catalytic domain type 1 short-chain-length polyhydroxyalkanoate depolymerase n=1 Tax=Pseudoduganella rhizocola TaxID=3382643 RepID=UPI0038B567DE